VDEEGGCARWLEPKTAKKRSETVRSKWKDSRGDSEFDLEEKIFLGRFLCCWRSVG
jgi:hypothetical protein